MTLVFCRKCNSKFCLQLLPNTPTFREAKDNATLWPDFSKIYQIFPWSWTEVQWRHLVADGQESFQYHHPNSLNVQVCSTFVDTLCVTQFSFKYKLKNIWIWSHDVRIKYSSVQLNSQEHVTYSIVAELLHSKALCDESWATCQKIRSHTNKRTTYRADGKLMKVVLSVS